MKKFSWKKGLAVASVASILLVGGTVYAATTDELKQERLETKQSVLSERVASGRITQEQANEILAKIQERMADCDGTCDGTGEGIRSRDGQGLMAGAGGFGNKSGNGAGIGAGAGARAGARAGTGNGDSKGMGARNGMCDGSGIAAK